jgi:hypothetical protein
MSDSRILHELVGAASLCWEPKPTGVFDTETAIKLVGDALAELRADYMPRPKWDAVIDAARSGDAAYGPPHKTYPVIDEKGA